jgi:hypothetical protein
MGPAAALSLFEYERRPARRAADALRLGSALTALVVVAALVGAVIAVAMSAARRRREIVLRQVLGASRWLVARTLLHQARAWLLGGPLAGGLVAAAWSAVSLTSLPGVVSVACVGAIAAVVLLAASAALVAALRASRGDLVSALAAR